MFKFECNREVIIDLPSGIYICSNDSATGKTFLYKMLSSFSSRSDILCVTYNTVNLIGDFESIICDRDVKLVVLDRYDMYEGKFLYSILKHREDITFIVDYKRGNLLNQFAKDCEVILTQDKLEVRSYDNI